MDTKWFSRKKLVFFIFATITLISLVISKELKIGQSEDNRYTIYSIRFEYYGMDATEMERIITIPLEEKITSLNDLLEIRSVAEYGKSITTVYFNKKINHKNTYLALRDAVDTLYNTLPQAVQKPRIYSSSAEKRPVVSIAVTTWGDLNVLRKYIDSSLKKELESVNGVAEVIITGGTIDEIKVEFDSDWAAKIGLNPEAPGSIIQDANVVSPGGILHSSLMNTHIVFNTKIDSIDQIKQLPIKAGEKITSLEHLADIAIKPRTTDEIVRINGHECVAIQIKAASIANIIKISTDCKKIIEQSPLSKEDYQILYDTGKLLQSMIKSVFIAILQSFICIIILIPLFFKSIRVVSLLLLFIPINCIWTSAILYLLGYTIDQNTLSGVSIALGLIVDAALVIAGISERNTVLKDYITSVKEVIRSIIASAATTILVLVPLFFLDYIVPGIQNVAVTITIMLINSVLLSCIFFPAFVFSTKESQSLILQPLFNTIKRFYIRLGYFLTHFSLKHKKSMCITYILLAISPFIVFVLSGKNITLDVKDTIIYAAVEYEPEKSGKSIDNELVDIIKKFKNINGVQFVRLESRKGTAEIEIGFDEKIINRTDLANYISTYSNKISNGFLYVPDTKASDKSTNHEIEIAVVGDEIVKCRELAYLGANTVGLIPTVNQTVLNFKNPEKTIFFTPHRDILAKNNITVETIASSLRWILFGPVVDKWIQNEREMDIRVSGKGLSNTNIANLTNLYIKTENDSVKLDTLGTLLESEGTGKIYRRDGRRAAYFTTHISSNSTDLAVNTIKNTLTTINNEKGYGFVLPRELELMQKQYRLLLYVFIASVIGILILLTALTENLFKSFIITSIIPVSAAFPFLIKFLTNTPLEMGDIVGIVVTGGISINNTIYIAESLKSSIHFRVREKIQSILVTSLTSIVGAIPLAIISHASGNTNNFSGALALSMILGTTGSLIGSLALFPAVYSLYLNFLQKKVLTIKRY